jgi:hypothetical protein
VPGEYVRAYSATGRAVVLTALVDDCA